MREAAHSEGRGRDEAEPFLRATGESASRRVAAPAGREADILALQQTAGNVAVTRMLAGARRRPTEAPVQRRAIAQDNVLSGVTGLTKQDAPRPLIGANPWQVGVYVPNNVPAAATKLEAINLAAQLSGTAANKVAAHYKELYEALDVKGKKAFSPTKPWTNVESKLNNADHTQIDPFFLDVTLDYRAGEEPHRMTLTFQHADRLSGYVTTVRDTGNPSTAAGVSLVDQPHAAPEPVSPPAVVGAPESGANPVPAQAAPNVVDPASTKYTKYGTSHEEAGNENILELTSGSGEKNLDAYTKLAGEGSRWEAVRKHSAFLKNTSRFFVVAPGDGTKVRSIEFRLLWKTWNSKFDKQYNIPDAKLSEYLLAGHPNYVVELDKAAMGDDDYDVAAGRPHRESRAAPQPKTG